MSFTEKKWLLESFEVKEHGTWKKSNNDKQSCFLKIVNQTVIIVVDEVAEHFIDLAGGAGVVEVTYANNSIGIKVIGNNAQTSQMRIFRICLGNGSSKTKSNYCIEVIEELKKFVPVFKHPSHLEIKSNDIEKQRVIDMIREFLTGSGSEPVTDDDFTSVIPDSELKKFFNVLVHQSQFPAKMVEIWVGLQQLLSKAQD